MVSATQKNSEEWDEKLFVRQYPMVVWTMAVEEKVDVVDARQSWPEARPDLEWGGGGSPLLAILRPV